MKFRKLISLALVLSVLSASAVGCSKGTNDSAKSGQSATESSSKAAGPVPDQITVGYGATWDSLTPFRSNIANDAPFASLIYESLACLDENNKNVPWAAKSWKTDDDGFTYDIEIFNNITDSAGNKITASDIVWFIQKSKEGGLKPSFSKVASVEKTGDYTLKVKMTTNMVGAFDLILRDTFVVSKAAFEASKDGFATDVVSTTQYKLTKFVAGSELNFQKRDNYWQTDANLIPKRMVANVNKVNYKIIREASQMGVALETGTIDVALSIDPNTGKQFKDNSKFTTVLSPMVKGYQIFFSGADNSVVANDQNLRQAIAYAIDAKGIVAGALAGYGDVMSDVASDAAQNYLQKWKGEDYYNYDVNKAKELVAKSGYKGQELTLLTTSDTTMQRISQMIQAYLAQAGIKLKLNVVDLALYTATRLDGTKYDIVINTVSSVDLPSLWSIRFDSKAYKTGDATSRHDTTLDELLYKTWVPSGWNDQNIDAVHKYLKDNMYAYGIARPQAMDIYAKKLNITKVGKTPTGALEITACK